MAAPLDSLIGEGLAPSPYAQAMAAYEDALKSAAVTMLLLVHYIDRYGLDPDIAEGARRLHEFNNNRRMPPC